MDIEHLPIKCRIEVYEDSIVNDPSASWHSTTPSLPIRVGAYIDPRTWMEDGAVSNNLKQNEILRVKAITHLLYQFKGSHVGHSLSVCFEGAPRPN